MRSTKTQSWVETCLACLLSPRLVVLGRHLTSVAPGDPLDECVSNRGTDVCNRRCV